MLFHQLPQEPHAKDRSGQVLDEPFLHEALSARNGSHLHVCRSYISLKKKNVFREQSLHEVIDNITQNIASTEGVQKEESKKGEWNSYKHMLKSSSMTDYSANQLLDI